MLLRGRIILIAVVFALLSTSLAYAAITGVISGTVTDSTGAVVPGVPVTALNQDTGFKQTAVTDGKGFYTFPVLDVGIYTVSATQTGFQSYSLKGIHVDANSSVRTDIALNIGAASQSVEVTSNEVQVETQSTQIGEVIESGKMTAVPLNGRSYTDLLALQPGVSPYAQTAEGSATSGGNSTVPVSGSLNAGMMSINGGRESSNGFMINGGNVNDGVQNGASIVPNLDSIAEFRILTSNFDAEYGDYAGGQVNVVTKNGTNQWHGSGFEFVRNTALNARGYSFSNPAPPKGAYNQNIYGGTLGGPIRHDRAFFFADFQGTNQSIGTTDSPQVPTAADLTGNVSDLSYLMTLPVTGTGWANVLSKRLGYTVKAGEPYYTATCSNTSQCVFPGAIIPKSAWDPVSANLFKYFPTVNGSIPSSGSPTGTVPAFVSTALANTLNDYKEAARTDFNTRFGTLFAYYFLDNYTLVNPYGGGTAPGWPAASTGRSQLVNLGLTTTFKNNSVNSFRTTYMRMAVHTTKPSYPVPGPSLASVGFVTPWGPTGGIDNVIPEQAGLPNISIDGMSFGTPTGQVSHYDNSFQWLDTYMKVVGTHTLQVGGTFHYDQINERNLYQINGSFSFSDSQETGNGFADFLLGAPSSFVQASPQYLDSRSVYVAAFLQDSWRARPDLTLNYGIRYEISTPWWEAANRIQTYNPGQQSVLFPGSPKGYVFPGDPGIPRGGGPVKYNKFAPRFGFDYAPKTGLLGKISGGGNLAIRGGFGIFYSNFQDGVLFSSIGDAPFGLAYGSSTAPMFSTPYVDRATQNIELQKFPFVFPPKSVSAANPDNSINWAALEPLSGDPGVSIHNTLPYLERYFFGFQRQFGRGTVLGVNYVGSEGRHLANGISITPGDQSLCLALNAAALAPGQTPCGPNLETNNFTKKDGTVVPGTRSLNIQDNCLCFGSDTLYQTEGTSNYNALQVNLKHTSKYWDVAVAYTWGKSFDEGSTQGGAVYAYNPKASYALSAYNVPQYVVASYNLHLPFDRWSSNTAVKHIIGGWSVAGISKFAAGTPVTVSESDDRALCNCGGDLPNYTSGNLFAGGASGDRNPRDINPATGKHNPYFNTALFSKETLGVYGNSKHRFFSGPGLDHTDISILRDFVIRERHTVQFRLEAFNVLNHAEFSAPAGTVNSASSFGNITSAVPNQQRVLQAAVKYHF